MCTLSQNGYGDRIGVCFVMLNCLSNAIVGLCTFDMRVSREGFFMQVEEGRASLEPCEGNDLTIHHWHPWSSGYDVSLTR